MADEVTSICVLVKEENGEELYLRVPESRNPSGFHYYAISVRRRRRPKTREPEWVYLENSGTLRLSPLLSLQEHNFHTANNWHVTYIRFNPTKQVSALQKLIEINS